MTEKVYDQREDLYQAQKDKHDGFKRWKEAGDRKLPASLFKGKTNGNQ